MTRKVAKKPETILSDAIREALSLEPGLLIWRNSNGVFRARGFVVHAGLPKGSADLVGVLGVDVLFPMAIGEEERTIGLFVALEVKRPGEKADPHQLEWLESVRRAGGFACVVTSAEEARAAIKRAREGSVE